MMGQPAIVPPPVNLQLDLQEAAVTPEAATPVVLSDTDPTLALNPQDQQAVDIAERHTPVLTLPTVVVELIQDLSPEAELTNKPLAHPTHTRMKPATESILEPSTPWQCH